MRWEVYVEKACDNLHGGWRRVFHSGCPVHVHTPHVIHDKIACTMTPLGGIDDIHGV
jgi:hypothetical protein